MWSVITARLARWNGIASLRNEARAIETRIRLGEGEVYRFSVEGKRGV
jgi:hypothetical protein